MYHNSVLITGSSKGLGKELATIFGKNNYNIILHGRNKERLESVKSEIELNNFGTAVDIVMGDLRDKQTIIDLADTAIRNNVTILINNAGVYEENIETIKVNLMSHILLTKKIAEYFKINGGGTVININSLAGEYDNEREPIYCASKAGLKSYMNSIRLGLRKYNIRIINVFMGAMNTAMVKRDKKNLIDVKEAAEMIYRIAKKSTTFYISNVEVIRKDD